MGDDLASLGQTFALRLNQEGLLFHMDYALRPYYYDGFSSFEPQHLFQITLVF